MADWTQPPKAGPPDGLSWIDRQFSTTSLFVLIIFSLCCAGIAFVLGVIGVVLCQDPRAKQKAIITTVISGIISAAATIVQLLALTMNAGP